MIFCFKLLLHCNWWQLKSQFGSLTQLPYLESFLCMHALETSQEFGAEFIHGIQGFFSGSCHCFFLHFSAASIGPNSVLWFFKSVKLWTPMIQNGDSPQARSYKNQESHSMLFSSSKCSLLYQPILGCFPLLSGR